MMMVILRHILVALVMLHDLMMMHSMTIPMLVVAVMDLMMALTLVLMLMMVRVVMSVLLLRSLPFDHFVVDVNMRFLLIATFSMNRALHLLNNNLRC
jgi:hypothetical protein